MKLPLFAIGIVGTLVGCGTSDATFVGDFAKVTCQSQRECFPDAFETEFEDVGDCTEQVEAVFEAFALGEGCTFNAPEARQCLSEARALSCDDLDSEVESEACGAVYTACGGDTDG